MAKIAQETGLTRQALYRSFERDRRSAPDDASPRLQIARSEAVLRGGVSRDDKLNSPEAKVIATSLNDRVIDAALLNSHRGNAAMPQIACARRPPAGVATSAIDPFSLEFLREPHPAHEALREAGPIVWLEKTRLRGRAACRGQADPQRSRELLLRARRGLERLSAREAVAAAEPRLGARPARARSRAGGAQSRPVGDGDAVLARALRGGRG